MDVKSLHRQMSSYHRWRRQLDERLQRFEAWNLTQGMATQSTLACLERARQLLRNETFTIACVGEFSRGKTELINALLYTGDGRRLLPSQPGRTTMCPTEIFWDVREPANCVRLLPIETRRSNTSLHSFKRIPHNWVTIPFDARDHEQTRAAINQVSASKQVEPAEAVRLGFDLRDLGERDSDGLVAIPAWRHALICLDHPLLRQGLRIVDTPGLNALGNEPELTLRTLPDAQAVLFMLSADTGVTASDMAIWREHIQALRQHHCTAVIALLNKVDSLWDELSSPSEIDATVLRLRQLTARQLALSPEHVVALSARQGLLAKIGRRPEQLERSNFHQLERMLGELLVRHQQQIVSHRLIGDCYNLVISSRNTLSRRLQAAEEELAELRVTAPRDAANKLAQLREQIRSRHHDYHKQSLSLRTSQRLLEAQQDTLLAPVSQLQLERHIDVAQQKMAQSWTSLGLTRAIGEFFEDVHNSIHHLEYEIERANRVLVSIFERPEHGYNPNDLIMRHLLKIQRQRRQLYQLQQRAELFRGSLSNLLLHRRALIGRFINTLVQEVRHVYSDINEHAQQWVAEALTPLFHNNHYQKQLLEQQMLRLTQLQGQRNDWHQQLESLQTDIYQLQTALDGIEPLYRDLLTNPLLPEAQSDQAPQQALQDGGAQVVSIQQARTGRSS